MLKSYFGIEKNPFSIDNVTLLDYQQDIYDILRVHSQQGGFCLLMGDPGTGKSVIKEAIKQQADKNMVVVSVSRTLHTYQNTIKILCQAFNIDFQGDSFKCEKRLIEEAINLNRKGKMLVIIIDDAHLMDIETLRKLRLMFEDFPKNHNVILVAQEEIMHVLNLRVNEDIRSRLTYSTTTKKLTNDDIKQFIMNQLDLVQLGHNIFSEEAINLIARSADGILRKVRNLALSCMLEAVRSQQKNVDLAMVNAVLIQPHWRVQHDIQTKTI
ncbi:AAA family ATPase [candidate division KSB1 bacterium]|nr:AAA family ATPase [candidate division KSB1 bacterium]